MNRNRTRKTLVTKIASDVTGWNDEMIEAMKVMMCALYAQANVELSFEVLIEDNEDRAEQALDLYQCYVKEFKVDQDEGI
jgi:hypothetical protein